MKENFQIRNVETSFGTVEYTFIYKKVEQIDLKIKANKEIVMVAPYGVAPEVGDRIILEKQDQIYNTLVKISMMVSETEKSYNTGDEFHYLGNVLTLVLEESDRDRVVNEEDRLYLYTKTPNDVKKKKKLVEKWFTVKRKSIYTKINTEIFYTFKRYKAPLAKLEIEHMTDKWGSCQPGLGIITLSTQLIDAPREAIEYVMVHEYAHFVHPDHSKNFHKVVDEIMPEWKENEKKLELTDFNKSF